MCHIHSTADFPPGRSVSTGHLWKTKWTTLKDGSSLRLIDSCITQLKVQGSARTCIESKAEEEVSRKGPHVLVGLGGGVLHLTEQPAVEKEFFIDNLPVRIHFTFVMIRWTGLAPWEFEFPFSGSVTSPSSFACSEARDHDICSPEP